MKKKYQYWRRIIFSSLVGFLFVGHSCISKNGKQEEYCTTDDFVKIDKIDIHCHVNTKRPAFMEQAVADNFRILTINTDAPIGVTIEEQEELALFQHDKFPKHLAYLTTFSLKGWEEVDWQEKTISHLKESLKKGAIGIKVWKNIGMVEKDKNGNFIMIDDPRFDPIFDYLEKNGIPVCGHIGEPRNCWLPLDSMTVNNDRIYFKDHPEYHMYLHPEFPSYDEQIASRDKILEKYPNLKFMGAHLGSMEWSVDMMADHFDRFPNLTVDMAARTCHLEAQAQKDWQKVRDFFIKYQDRIIYGTDGGDYEGVKPEEVKPNSHTAWANDWKFLTTDDTMSTWEVNGEFKGLKLPKEVVEKIYYKNAEKLFPEFKKL